MRLLLKLLRGMGLAPLAYVFGHLGFRPQAEMMVWDQCSRLIAAVILYYNAYILNHLYLKAKTREEKDWILGLSPSAWAHINLLGYYQFCGLESSQYIDQWPAQGHWQSLIPSR